MNVVSPSPVALFAFRRPQHLRQTLEALARSPQAGQTPVFAFLDAAQQESDVRLVEAACGVLEEIRSLGVFERLVVNRAEEPKGLAMSVIEGLSLVLKDYERVIGLEDDIVLAPSGLGFLNGALDAYEHDRRVWSVSAFSPALRMPLEYEESIYFARRASSWGYATWRDRWKEVTWDDEYFRRLASSSRFRRRLALGGNDLPPMLDKQLSGAIDSWAVRWCARQAELGALTVYPTTSLVLNTGLDGTGTHSPVLDASVGPLGDWTSGDGVFGEPRLNRRIARSFRREYVSRTRLIASSLLNRLRG